MQDLNIEEMLRRYRPVDPPARLRARVLSIAARQRIWPWAIAAAALLLVTVIFHRASGNAIAVARVTAGPAISNRMTDDLTSILGGDEAARALAEAIVLERQVRDEAVDASGEAGLYLERELQ